MIQINYLKQLVKNPKCKEVDIFYIENNKVKSFKVKDIADCVQQVDENSFYNCIILKTDNDPKTFNIYPRMTGNLFMDKKLAETGCSLYKKFPSYTDLKSGKEFSLKTCSFANNLSIKVQNDKIQLTLAFHNLEPQVVELSNTENDYNIAKIAFLYTYLDR